MHSHRILGAGLILAGLAMLFGQLALLYGGATQQGWMVAVGLPGVAVFSSLGAVCFAFGCLLAAAPRSTVRHVRRAARALRGRRAGDGTAS